MDTETTGFKNPKIVQMAWLISDEKGIVHKTKDYLVKVNCEIPVDATKVHGITKEMTDKNGVPVEKVLNEFIKDSKDCILVCHNLGFDVNRVVNLELKRLNWLDLEEKSLPEIKICTMLNTTDYFKIPAAGGRRGYKWPKLEEAYQLSFDEELENAHNAMIDVLATYRVFFHLKAKGVSGF